MNIIYVNYNIIGPLVCFSNFSVLFGYNSVEQIAKHYLEAGYNFFTVTDINLFSAFMSMNKQPYKNKIYGLTINLEYNNAIGFVYVIFYCQQGYYNFLIIYNKKILNNLKTEQNDIIFHFDDFKHIRDNYGFYILIGNKLSILQHYYKQLVLHNNNNIINTKIKAFFHKVCSIFKNNVLWSVSNINKSETILYNIITKFITNTRNIIYNYPIINLTNKCMHEYTISPHINLISIQQHKKITDIIIEENNYFGNEYFLCEQHHYIKTIHDAQILHNSYLFFRKFYFFQVNLCDHELSLKYKHARQKVYNIVHNNFTRLIITLHEKYNITTQNNIKICNTYYQQFMYELHIYDKINEKVDVYSMLWIMYKIIQWSKSNDVPIGPGRGSCVGSLIIYLLDITTIDPIRHELLFERFLHVKRANMPDIDIDVCKEKRNTLLKHISSYFQTDNANNIVHIIVFLKFVFKMMIKDLIKTSNSSLRFIEINKLLQIYDNKDKMNDFIHQLQYMLSIISKYSSHISYCAKYPSYQNFILRALLYRIYLLVSNILVLRKDSLLQLININEHTLDTVNQINSKFIELSNIMLEIENYHYSIRTTGIHAAGILIGEKKFSKKIPLFIGSNADNESTICTHYDIDMLSNMNTTKFDILGLDNLTIIHEFYSIMGITYDTEDIFDFMLTPQKSLSAYLMLQHGVIKNIFQMEKIYIGKISHLMKIQNFDDIVAINALNRPGTSQTIHTYIKNKKDILRKYMDEHHEYFNQVTQNTYGVIIYQEQIMEIVKLMGRYTASESDIFRSVISKKKFDLLQKEKDKFLQRCEDNNITTKEALEIFNTIHKFAGYAFNKSHAVAYSKITAITTYTKYFYYIQYNLICIKHKYQNTQKVIEIIVEMAVVSNMWFNYEHCYNYMNKINYDTLEPQLQFNYDKIQQHNIIYLSLPVYIAKGVSKSDIENLVHVVGNNFEEKIIASNMTKSKIKILNNLNFFQNILNIDKLYKTIENIRMMRIKTKGLLYKAIHKSSKTDLLTKHTIEQHCIKQMDIFSIDNTGLSIVRANIVYIVKKIIYSINKELKYNLYVVYKVYKTQVHMVNISHMIYQRSINTSTIAREFDIFYMQKDLTTNITEHIIQSNNFSFIHEILHYQHNNIFIQYTHNHQIHMCNIQKINLMQIYQLINHKIHIKITTHTLNNYALATWRNH